MAGRLDDILADAFVDDLDGVSTEELRRRRAVCEEEERGVSYARRVLQGRLDILRAELLRRESGGDEDAAPLLARLPDILGHDQIATDPVHARATGLAIPEVATSYTDELDAVVDEPTLLSLPERPVGELEELIDRLAEHERYLSGIRRQLFDRIDRLREELAARYKNGRASIGELLGTDG